MSNKNDIGDHKCSGNLLFADLGHRLIKRILENVDMSEPDSSDIELSLMRIIGERDKLREQVLHCVKPYSGLEERIRKIITSACSSVWRDTINDLSAQGSITRSVHYAMREIVGVIDEQIRQKLLYESYKNERCPICGYYCLGKGGVGCIDKPTLCGLKERGTLQKRKHEQGGRR